MRAVRGALLARFCQPACYELWIQATVALFQITAIRHLRNDVRRSQHIAKQAEYHARQLDFAYRSLKTSEMHDLPSDWRKISHVDDAHVFFDESCATRSMGQCVFRAVVVTRVMLTPDVTDVVQQGRYRSENKETRPDRLAVFTRTLIAVHYARHRQRDIQGVLQIVVTGITRPVTGILTTEYTADIVKGLIEMLRRRIRIQRLKYAVNFQAHGSRIGGVHPIRDIVLVAS